MSVSHTRTTGAIAPQDSDTPMFAPIPSWERGRKRRGSGRATVSNSAAAPIINDEVARETAMSADGDAPFVAPQTRTVVRRNGSVAPAAIAVGLIALAALAAAGWYATRPADTAMTPGATPATAIATAPLASGAGALAVNTPPPSAADTTATTPSSMTTTTTSHRAVATHAAAASAPAVRSHSTTFAATPRHSVTSRSATSAGVNTGATLSQTPAGATPSTAMPPPAATAQPVTTMPTPAPAPWTITPNVSPAPGATTAPSTTTTTTTTPPPV